MIKTFMRFVGLGEKPTVAKPEPKPESKKEPELSQEVIDDIKRWRHIQNFATAVRTNKK